MSDIIVRARQLTKTYRLYAKPHYRLLDMLGLIGAGSPKVTEHIALNALDLDIERGEKVAIIGRNGAGKSTLLKLITQVTEPTSGTIEIKGQTRALLQLGTGFHPDFTGRENIIAYLGQMGIGGRKAAQMVEDIIDFAELEEYIDQPVKTYSSGMGMRLTFAASTVIMPDVLVIDEVLGVGDAYFQNKSFERMKELCTGFGTTLVLVTHDIYSAARLCDRMVWIDHGRILIDGPPDRVTRAYESSIREQEEARLRLRKRPTVLAPTTSQPAERVIVELRAEANQPQPCPVYWHAITLRLGQRRFASLPLGPDDAEATGIAFLQRDGSNWGEPERWQGQDCRALLNYGSPFQKVAGVFEVPAGHLGEDAALLDLHLEYGMAEACAIHVVVFLRGREYRFGPVPPLTGRWVSHVAHWIDAPDAAVRDEAASGYEAPPPAPAAPSEAAAPAATQVEAEAPAAPAARPVAALPGVNTTGVFGAGDVAIDDVRCLGPDGQESFVLTTGRPMTLAIDYTIHRPGLKERAQVLIAFKRDKIQDVFRLFTRDLLFDAAGDKRGTVTVGLASLPLAAGLYGVTVMIAKEGYYDRPQSLFFTINPEVYFVVSNTIELNVMSDHLVHNGTAVIGEAAWSLSGR